MSISYLKVAFYMDLDFLPSNCVFHQELRNVIILSIITPRLFTYSFFVITQQELCFSYIVQEHLFFLRSDNPWGIVQQTECN